MNILGPRLYFPLGHSRWKLRYALLLRYLTLIGSKDAPEGTCYVRWTRIVPLLWRKNKSLYVEVFFELVLTGDCFFTKSWPLPCLKWFYKSHLCWYANQHICLIAYHKTLNESSPCNIWIILECGFFVVRSRNWAWEDAPEAASSDTGKVSSILRINSLPSGRTHTTDNQWIIWMVIDFCTIPWGRNPYK